ncbi:MAG: HRDC domain-containing protein [Thiothrix sp.]
MKLRFFSIDALEPDDDQSVVDDFCTQHRLISIDKRFVERGDYCYWSVCVTYLEPSSSPAKPTKAVDKKGRIDYREALPPEDFDRYSRLRDLRRELAEAEGAPVYTVFSNAQLAKMVTEWVNTVLPSVRPVCCTSACISFKNSDFAFHDHKAMIG